VIGTRDFFGMPFGLIIVLALLAIYFVGSLWSGKWDWLWAWLVDAVTGWTDPDAARTARVARVQRDYRNV